MIRIRLSSNPYTVGIQYMLEMLLPPTLSGHSIPKRKPPKSNSRAKHFTFERVSNFHMISIFFFFCIKHITSPGFKIVQMASVWFNKFNVFKAELLALLLLYWT